ncbi:MAG: rhodanese-like domain-containing protein [Bacteroidetes bacterium]|nr:rhodanese-like domain-containing protein [Bacteroidota bacterium]
MYNISKLSEMGITIVDVRTPGEYEQEHFEQSINIPLGELLQRLNELENAKEVIVCCASGIRSNKALNLLRQHGINCHDAGSWLNLKALFILNKQ